MLERKKIDWAAESLVGKGCVVGKAENEVGACEGHGTVEAMH